MNTHSNSTTIRPPSKTTSIIITAHWGTVLQGHTLSPDDFYTSLEKAFRDQEIGTLRIGRIALKEAGLFSKTRLYFRMTYGDLFYDICAANIGRSSFVSSWLGVKPYNIFYGLLILIPRVGEYFAQRMISSTYLQYDTMMVFQEIAHSTLLQTIDDLTEENGLRRRTGQERKPIMRQLLRNFPPEGTTWTEEWNQEEKT